MKLIQENYLDQITEDLEIVNYKLDRMFSEAIVSNKDSASDDFSLLEGIDASLMETSDTVVDAEKFTAYAESLTVVLKNIWKQIVRFVKMVFVSSGKKMTTGDIKKIIEVLDGAEPKDLTGPKMKEAVQKGMYIIAGLSNSVDGAALKRAYETGDTINFVMANIGKVRVDKIPDDTTFRVCIATYNPDVKTSLQMTIETLKTLAAKGINGIKALGENVKKKFGKEKMESSIDFLNACDTILLEEVSAEGDEKNITYDNLLQMISDSISKTEAEKNAATGSDKDALEKRLTDLKKLQEEAKSTPKHDKKAIAKVSLRLKRIMSNGAAATRAQKLQDKMKNVSKEDAAIIAAGVAATGIASVAATGIADGVLYLVKKAKAKKDERITMATVTYMNENKENARAVFRMYGEKSMRPVQVTINGKEAVMQLRTDLVALAEEMQATGDNLGAGSREYVMEFAQNIMTVFSGLASKE